MTKHLLFTLVFATCSGLGFTLAPITALAQQEAAPSTGGGDDIESLYSQEEEAPAAVEVPVEKPADKQVQQADIKDITDLVQLAPFKDVAVIQKRFLPKTGRFEFFGGPTVVLNDAFFLNFGLNARLAYYFRERYGIEFVGMYLTTSERQVTTDLREKRGVTTTSIVTPKNYMGLDFKWTPIYGKMTWMNKKITPFDLYFSGGGGMTGTNQGSSEPTVHLGTGQIFAISKSMAFRWDFSWNFYNAKSSVTSSSSSSLYNNLFITVGMSFFFPEATYR